MKITKLLSILLILFIGLNFNACSSDNDDNNDENSEIKQNTKNYFYGKWKSTFSSGYQIYEFKSNGTVSMSEIDYEDENYTETGQWSFNTSKSTLTITWDDDYTDKVKISFLGNNQFKVLSEDGEETDDWGDGGILTRQ